MSQTESMMASQALRHVPSAYSFQHISIQILILPWVFWKWSCTLPLCSLKSSFQLPYSFEKRSIFQARLFPFPLFKSDRHEDIFIAASNERYV